MRFSFWHICCVYNAQRKEAGMVRKTHGGSWKQTGCKDAILKGGLYATHQPQYPGNGNRKCYPQC